jgi:hypothetical protein
MKCFFTKLFLSLFEDSNSRIVKYFKKHSKTCTKCREAIDREKVLINKLQQDFQKINYKAPAFLSEKIIAKIENQHRHTIYSNTNFKTNWMPYAACFSLILVLSVATITLNKKEKKLEEQKYSAQKIVEFTELCFAPMDRPVVKKYVKGNFVSNAVVSEVSNLKEDYSNLKSFYDKNAGFISAKLEVIKKLQQCNNGNIGFFNY